MAIPKFEDFLYPFLYQLKDGSLVSAQDMKNALIGHFQLTEEDCALKTKNGSTFQLSARVNWVRQWLHRARFIESPQKGVYHITERGKTYLASHKDLRKADLMAYKEFAEFALNAKSVKDEKTSKTDSETESVDEMAPIEQMDAAYQSIKDDVAAELLEKVLSISPSFFEKLVLDLLLRMGYGGRNQDMAIVTPPSKDNGVDGIIPEDALGLDKIYIQAKRYKAENPVGKPEIQRFLGALEEQKSTKGVFITTSDFTTGAKETAAKASKKIVLINGKTLTEYMIEYNVGVSVATTYEIKKIDSDYFEE